MCASKWINKNLFTEYAKEKEKEITEKTNNLRRSDFVWASPQAGTSEKAKVYEGRFLPDKKGKFTRKYYYHMWKSGDKWIFYLCPKTDDMTSFCSVCSIVSNLYSGTSEDKSLAFKMKRKERHVSNFFVVDDPRDKDTDDETKKASGKVKLYEFPSKLESKLKNEVLDKKEGLGYAIFDPGPEGHNLILKIKSTKQDAKGNSYPDYSDSIFSRKSSSIVDGGDTEIKKVMEETRSIDEYIESMKMSPEDTVKMLKNEMLWDMVEHEWSKHMGGEADVREEVNERVKARDGEEDVPAEIGEPPADTMDDADLMAELRSMK